MDNDKTGGRPEVMGDFGNGTLETFSGWRFLNMSATLARKRYITLQNECTGI